jgi:hypothetical protein
MRGGHGRHSLAFACSGARYVPFGHGKHLCVITWLLLLLILLVFVIGGGVVHSL